MSGQGTESESAPVQELWRLGPAGVAAAQRQPVQAERDPDWVWELEAALEKALEAAGLDQRGAVQPLQALAPVRGLEEVLRPEQLLCFETGIGLAGPGHGFILRRCHRFGSRFGRQLWRRRWCWLRLFAAAAIEPVVNHQPTALDAASWKRLNTPLIIRRPCSSL